VEGDTEEEGNCEVHLGRAHNHIIAGGRLHLSDAVGADASTPNPFPICSRRAGTLCTCRKIPTSLMDESRMLPTFWNLK